MTIQELKDQLGYPTLQLNTALDSDDKPTEWYRHWDNDNRIAVSIHKDTFENVKNDPSISTLALQKEIKEGAQGEYTALRIVQYKPAENTL